MNKQIRWMVPVALLLIVVSCKKNSGTDTPVPVPDTTPPTINLVDPVPGKSFVLGSPLHLQMDLSDNVELKLYKVTIGKGLKGLETADWAFSQIWTIPSGKKSFAVNHNEITVPLTVTGKQTTTGNYDIIITCLDTSNNETSKSLTIVLTK